MTEKPYETGSLFQTDQNRAQGLLRHGDQYHRTILNSIGDGVISADMDGRVDGMNPAAEALTGWHEQEALGKPLNEVFRVVRRLDHLPVEKLKPIESPFIRALRQEKTVELPDDTLLIARNGREIPIGDSSAPIEKRNGETTGVVIVFRDQTEERRAQRLIDTRLALIEYAADHTLDALLTRSLDEVCAYVESPVGFYHFVDDDQKHLSLQQWSSRTLKEFCRAGGKGRHYDVDRAGVWVDCVREGKSVIHNDYDSLPHKKGLPEGHPKVVRELVVPVMRQSKVVGVLGVGNKPVDYTQHDVRTVAYLADLTWHIVEIKRAEEANARAARDWNVTFDAINDAICLLDEDGRVLRHNHAFKRLTNSDGVEITGRFCYEVVHHRSTFIDGCPLVQAREDRKRRETEIEIGDRWLRIKVDPVFSENGEINRFVCVMVDITARKRMEAENEQLQGQFVQAQKMESVGRLAGGVAHDFNNLLSIILGYGEMVLEGVREDHPHREPLRKIHEAAVRARELTRQLLAFSRKQVLDIRPVDVNAVITGFERLLRRVLGEDIELKLTIWADPLTVEADTAQLEQVLMNLAVNARDAMPDGGTLTLQTARVALDEAYTDKIPGVTPGDYAMIEVSDTGAGMDKETLARIFEPFFTTKDKEKGTGLGLATSYGIVKQHGGNIWVYSEPDHGTTFKIYLPLSSTLSSSKTETVPKRALAAGTATILVVEDDPAVRKLAVNILKRSGYGVIESDSVADAIQKAAAHRSPIHLVLTDVIMPGMKGPEVFTRIAENHPEAGVLYMSGYTDDVIVRRGVLQKGIQYIQKPFTVNGLLEKTAAALKR